MICVEGTLMFGNTSVSHLLLAKVVYERRAAMGSLNRVST